MRGIEKSSKMQDRIINRMDGYRTEETARHELPTRAWTPERWAHRMPKAEATKSLDLSALKTKFNVK
jgi:hypothetical protein